MPHKAFVLIIFTCFLIITWAFSPDQKPKLLTLRRLRQRNLNLHFKKPMSSF